MQEHIPVDEVFEQLRCSRQGLTDAEAEVRIKICGPNKLEEKSVCFSANTHSSIVLYTQSGDL